MVIASTRRRKWVSDQDSNTAFSVTLNSRVPYGLDAKAFTWANRALASSIRLFA